MSGVVTHGVLCMIVFFGLGGLGVAVTVPPTPNAEPFQYEQALAESRAAIGRALGTYTFRDRQNRIVPLTAFRGKPLIISMIYTSCYQICSMTTRYLAEMVRVARGGLGSDAFNVVTIGFDTRFDTPVAMAAFARQQRVADEPNWRFLSTDADTIQRLAKDLGFSFYRSPKGFEHVVQSTVVDGNGVIYRQVYGEAFDPPLLGEPLKELVLGRPRAEDSFVDDLVRRVRFFCTVYDPSREGYRFDYSLFVGMFIGGLIILATAWFIGRELWSQRKPRGAA
jgi:protein SCO1/2